MVVVQQLPLLDINTKSYDNQRQIRNRVISGINHKLYSFFDSKDFICRSPNVCLQTNLDILQ